MSRERNSHLFPCEHTFTVFPLCARYWAGCKNKKTGDEADNKQLQDKRNVHGHSILELKGKEPSYFTTE